VIEPEQAKKLGVLSQQVQPGTFSMIIKTSGQVQAAQGDETTVVAPVSGIVSFSRPLSEGASVKKGESLLSISSQNIAEGDPVVKAKLAYETAEKEYRRAVSLVKDTLISQAEFEQAHLNFETTKVTYDALSKSQTGKGTSASSSTGGYIKNRLVNEGEYVTTGQPLLTVSQNQKLYLRADVSEKYYAQLPAVISANFKTPYDNQLYRLEDLKGRLVSFGKSANAASFYIPVVFEFDNVGTFVPGAFVEVYLLTAKTDNVLTLPLGAVIEDQGLYFVFEQISADAYKKQEVKIGDDNGQDVRILSGIHPGDRIVTQGALHVKLASNASSLPEHSHSH
jgi:RND family efflux transporter MFP subunit